MGFAQKFGPVLSYIRIANEPADINQVRIGKTRADAVIGCDLVVSSSPRASMTYGRGRTRALINTAEMATGDFARHRDANLRADDRLAAIGKVLGEDGLTTLDANAIAGRLMGNTIYSNVLLLGAAWQDGLVPVSLKALMRAIELNGVEVERNKEAFTWGRIAADHPEHIEDLLHIEHEAEETLDELIERRAVFLTDYQDTALAARYRQLVDQARGAETAVGGDGRLTAAVARSYFKLLSYKDEYEVARLHTQTGFLADLKKEYGASARIRFHFAPPILNLRTDSRGRPIKREFGTWMLPILKVLARMKRLRGTRFDIFGSTAERRMERALIREFENRVEQLLGTADAGNLAELAGIVEEYMDIRGYGSVKDRAVEEVRTRVAHRISNLAARDTRVTTITRDVA